VEKKANTNTRLSFDLNEKTIHWGMHI